MYKMLLSSAVLASAIFGLSQSVLANETLNGTMAQSGIGEVNVNTEQVKTVQGVVTNIAGGRYAPVTNGHQAIVARQRVGGDIVTIRADDDREYVQRISPEAQASAGIKEGETVELSFVQAQLVAISGPSGNYQVAEVKSLETVAAASAATSSSAAATESTTTTVIKEQPMAQPQPVESTIKPQMW
jgi:hypothetical protein